MSRRHCTPLAFLVVLTSAVRVGAQERTGAFDPVTQDEAPDTAWPAAMRTLAIESHGSIMNGVLYLAAGRGPHPTVVVLHGYPGNEQNLDLAQAIRRGGMNVVAFHYRGTWGSGGFFSLSNALEDVGAVVAYLRDAERAARYRADPDHIVLVGHSMGAWLALMASARDPRLAWVAGIGVANMGAAGRAAAADPQARQAMVASIRASVHGEAGPIRVAAGYAPVDTMIAHAAEWDLTAQASSFAGRHVLLVGAADDRNATVALNHIPVAEALTRGGADVRELLLDTDHSFSGARIALARTLIAWLQGRAETTRD